jgi:hypothetical protein
LIKRLYLWRLKFIDESGVNISMTRLYGRGPRGERVVGSVPQNWGQNLTMLAALSVTGAHSEGTRRTLAPQIDSRNTTGIRRRMSCRALKSGVEADH